MSRPFLTFFAINTITTVFITTLYNFYLQLTFNDVSKYDFMLHKIKELEMSVKRLQNSIEEIEEHNNIKNNSIIESNIALTSKLDDFINYSYDVYENDN